MATNVNKKRTLQSSGNTAMPYLVIVLFVVLARKNILSVDDS